MQKARLVEATGAGTVTFEIELGDEYSNSAGTHPQRLPISKGPWLTGSFIGTLHGGAVALILGSPAL